MILVAENFVAKIARVHGVISDALGLNQITHGGHGGDFRHVVYGDIHQLDLNVFNLYNLYSLPATSWQTIEGVSTATDGS